MATQTTYYEFNKPSGTDLVNPLVDTNPNWDIADAALHELNERSVANCTEVVSLGVHALSTLNTDTKFLKWIATANFTAGETFTLNGIAVAAATPSGAPLATNAYVSGAVVMACLNSDNTAMTVFLSGTNVASDSERLGGELPSYYATNSDMGNAQTDITNIQNALGNTSIVGIGDGTVTGAIDDINNDLTTVKNIVSGNTAGTAVSIGSVYSVTPYTCNSDGYVYCNSAGAGQAVCRILDKTSNLINPLGCTGQAGMPQYVMCFVKKGMQIQFVSASGLGEIKFTPIS